MPSVTYQQLLHDIAIRLSALVGTNKAQITASYDNAVLTAANFKSADWPFNAFRDACVMAVGNYSWAIADTGSHPWRQYLDSVTVPLATGVALPSVSATNKDIIGVWGAVYDSTDNRPLTEQPLDVIRRANQAGWRTYPLYYFKIDGGRIEHTRPFAVVEVCTFSQADALTAFDANAAIALPDSLRTALMAEGVGLLTKDGAFSDQAATYREYSAAMLARIRAGLTTLPAKTLPTPTMSAT